MTTQNKIFVLDGRRLSTWFFLMLAGVSIFAGISRDVLCADGPKQHWAFRSIPEVPIPRVKDRGWLRTSVDSFILAALESRGLRPAPQADRRTFLRRVYFDLIGLPPSPDEMQSFLSDRSPDACAKVVERLLASPRYGERWGRHWLDCVRYADSNGLDENYHWANAWRYRDYVIDSFNQDTPYDQFIVEQLAGDLIPLQTGESEQDRYRRIIATGFLMIGPKLSANPDKEKVALDIIDEQIDATSRAFLSLTIACARCHDHKFDPITQNDYYGLAGIFKSTRTMKDIQQRLWMERPLASPDAVARAEEFNLELDAKKKSLEDAKKKKTDATVVAELENEVSRLETKRPREIPYAMAVTDDRVQDLPVFTRGDHSRPSGDPIARHFPVVLGGQIRALTHEKSGRLELAQWIASHTNPLTARVIVNRIWQWHFGVGLVSNSENFGALGDEPVNASLLDHLASYFVKSGWSIKEIHREIILSSTYRMSTAGDPRALRVDPENRLLWRSPRRRLDVETLRDSMLMISDTLDLSSGGSLLSDVPNMQRITTDNSDDFALKAYSSNRRSVYLPVVRNSLFSMFELFDFADPSSVTSRRNETVVAPQALFLMNNPFMQERARAFAASILKVSPRYDHARVNLAYSKVFGRLPTAEESDEAIEYIGMYSASTQQANAWQSFCQALLASNEFMYVD